MKRALVALIAIGLAACGGASDLEPAVESFASPTPPALATTETAPKLGESTSIPSTENEPQLTPIGEVITPGSEGSEYPVDAAVKDLAERLDVAPAAIQVDSLEKVIWKDASLGCPVPNVMYSQVLTEGFRVVLMIDGQVYPYHTDTRGSLVLCLSGIPELPILPLEPGEIQDGQPWMPAGTAAPGEPDY